MSAHSKEQGESFFAQRLTFSEVQEVVRGQFRMGSASHTSLNPSLVRSSKQTSLQNRSSQWVEERTRCCKRDASQFAPNRRSVRQD